MKENRREILLMELETQIEFALLSFDNIQRILIMLDQGERPDISPFWYYCQNLIIYSGNISKLLWGVSSKNKAVNDNRKIERKELRALLSVKEDSLLKNRSIRNALEHVDEKLEEFTKNERNIVVDRYFGPPQSLISFGDDTVYDASKEKNLRYYNPETKIFYFYGTNTNLELLVREIKKLKRAIEAYKDANRFY